MAAVPQRPKKQNAACCQGCQCPCCCETCTCPYMTVLAFTKQLTEAGVCADKAAEIAAGFVATQCC